MTGKGYRDRILFFRSSLVLSSERAEEKKNFVKKRVFVGNQYIRSSNMIQTQLG
jgi:hypothetical protein